MSSKKDNVKEIPLLFCCKCKSSINLKQALKCTLCKKHYDFDCSGTSEKLYRLMDKNTRQKWKCKECIRTEKNQSNVTVRKKATKQETAPCPPSPKIKKTSSHTTCQKPNEKSAPQNEVRNSTLQNETLNDSHILTEGESSDDECFSGSLLLSRSADFTSNNTALDRQTDDTIAQLTSELCITQNELENTILENNKLHRQIKKMTNEIQLLKKLCKQTPDNSCNKQRKRHSMFIASTSEFSSMVTPSRPSSAFKFGMNMNEITGLQDKITMLQSELNKAKELITILEENVRTLNDQLSTKKISSSYISRTDSATITTKEIWPNRQITQKSKPLILIYGSQQCVGLASALIHTRQDSEYIRKCGIHDYQIIAETKPYALSNDILGSSISSQLEMLKPGDKVILNIGENDYNPEMTLLLFKQFIEKYDNVIFLLLSVLKNHYLDVSHLNERLKMICKNYKNCYFVTCDRFGKKSDICLSINCIIDSIDYNDKYLKSGQIVKLISRNKPNNLNEKGLKYPKGTIPYYFARERTQIASSDSGDSVENLNLTTMKNKGTITYYFPKIMKNQSFFRN